MEKLRSALAGKTNSRGPRGCEADLTVPTCRVRLSSRVFERAPAPGQREAQPQTSGTHAGRAHAHGRPANSLPGLRRRWAPVASAGRGSRLSQVPREPRTKLLGSSSGLQGRNVPFPSANFRPLQRKQELANHKTRRAGGTRGASPASLAGTLDPVAPPVAERIGAVFARKRNRGPRGFSLPERNPIICAVFLKPTEARGSVILDLWTLRLN